jgi:hypothetical protein
MGELQAMHGVTPKQTRRRFLKTAGAISAGSLTSWSQPGRQALARSPNERRRFALIGVGGNGTRTAPVRQQFADLVALCDIDAEHLKHDNGGLGDKAASKLGHESSGGWNGTKSRNRSITFGMIPTKMRT